MNGAALYRGRPAAEALGPLDLTKRIDGVWLAIRAGTEPVASSIVLADCDAGAWRTIDAEAPLERGAIADAHLTPLADFGVSVTLYRHSRVLSVWRSGISRARFHGHTAGGHIAWAGPRVARIKLPPVHAVLDAIAAAARDCNTLGRVRP